MKIVYSSLIAVVAVVFAAVALADPGTTWEKQINRPGRFQVLNQFGGEAVFDKETGRVWEQAPVTTEGTRDWFSALVDCYRRQVGGRIGWRLPTIEELSSLVDPSQATPSLPPDHPFDNVQSSDDRAIFYWSATSNAFNTSGAWVVTLRRGGGVSVDDKSSRHFVWCVRGGQGIDGVQ